jgi:anhydro-N-acetylmuramic acid kinase
MSSRWVIGLASGSSGAAVEAALLKLEGAGLDLRAHLLQAVQLSYSRDVRDLIRRITGWSISHAGPQTQGPKMGTGAGLVGTKQMSLLHRLLGETFAAAARQVADRASFSLQKVHCLGCSGHTIWHDPEGRFPSTLALGMAAVLAERTGVTTISDFPSRDLAVGGQGTPLAALVDYLLFHHPGENRIMLHLGGGARVVHLPAEGKVHDAMGFEAGPCNRLLDGLIGLMTGGREMFDPSGKHAVQGRCIESLLQQWLGLAYLKRRPPKSLPHHGLAEDLILQAVELARQGRCQLHDLLCTATHFVARSISHSCQRFIPVGGLPTRVLLSGGGVRNGFLWHLLEQQLAPLPLAKMEEFGIVTEARKSVDSAILAAFTLDGVPANLPSVTGASGARLLGSITPGSPSNWARCLAWMAGQISPLSEEWNEAA